MTKFDNEIDTFDACKGFKILKEMNFDDFYFILTISISTNGITLRSLELFFVTLFDLDLLNFRCINEIKYSTSTRKYRDPRAVTTKTKKQPFTDLLQHTYIHKRRIG